MTITGKVYPFCVIKTRFTLTPTTNPPGTSPRWGSSKNRVNAAVLIQYIHTLPQFWRNYIYKRFSNPITANRHNGQSISPLCDKNKIYFNSNNKPTRANPRWGSLTDRVNAAALIQHIRALPRVSEELYLQGTVKSHYGK